VSPKPGRKDAKILGSLAANLPDDVLRKVIPDIKPEEVRQRLSALAGEEKPARKSQLKLSAGGGKATGVFVLHSDGASRGNPGEAGAGACIFDHHGNEVYADCRYLGQCTNNVAEYQALLLGLEAAVSLKILKLTVRLDSELIVRQLAGRYRVKDRKLKPLFEGVKSLMTTFSNCRVTHVPRSENARADELANRAIDQHKC